MVLDALEKSQGLDDVLAKGQHGRQGLGFKRSQRKSHPRAAIVEKMKKEAESNRLSVLHNYQMQASWLSWGLDAMMKRDLSWNTILHQYSQRLLKFMANSQLNTLPSPDNLRRWNLNKDAACGLCGQKAVTLSHILAGCTWVRLVENKRKREDRYKWRHNNVLHLLASEIRAHLKVINLKKAAGTHQREFIHFVRAGTKPTCKNRAKSYGLLSGGNDWCCDFDLPKFHDARSKYVFPHDVCITPLKIDGHIISRAAKICIGIELTCPMEENVTKWHSEKYEKYEAEISSEANVNGWKYYSLIIEVGARGWVPTSVAPAFRSIGLNSVRDLCNRLSLLALKSSYVIWINRFNQDFHDWRLS